MYQRAFLANGSVDFAENVVHTDFDQSASIGDNDFVAKSQEIAYNPLKNATVTPILQDSLMILENAHFSL